jgi:uncharacterized protein (DUF2147 family)
MLRTFIAAVAVALQCCSAFAADDIVGRWRTGPGDTAAISKCGKAYCVVLTDGDYAGRQVGRVAANGPGIYAGFVVNPQNGHKYSGNAKLSGNSLKMRGCMLGGLVCQSQVWVRL